MPKYPAAGKPLLLGSDKGDSNIDISRGRRMRREVSDMLALSYRGLCDAKLPRLLRHTHKRACPGLPEPWSLTCRD